MEGFWCISQAKWYDQKLKVAKVTTKGYLLYVFLTHLDLMVPRLEIYFVEKFGSMKLIH